MANPYGLGALESPPDRHDLQIEEAFAAAGIVPAAPPARYDVPKLPPVASFDQDGTPKCVAYSSGLEQASFDLSDLGHNYRWDFDLFFRRIGGTAAGAIPRNALSERLHRGYPLLPANSGNSAAAHRIAAYYAITKSRLAICQAMQAFGVLLVSTPWYHSWFRPDAAGVLPDPDYQVGRHLWAAVGWRPEGIRAEQTWGVDYAKRGFFIMPWPFVLHSASEAWKAVDVLTAPKPS